MNPFTFTQRAGRKKNNGLFALFRRGRMSMGRRHVPMQATSRRRFLRQSLDLEQRMGWIPTFRSGDKWVWPK